MDDTPIETELPSFEIRVHPGRTTFGAPLYEVAIEGTTPREHLSWTEARKLLLDFGYTPTEIHTAWTQAKVVQPASYKPAPRKTSKKKKTK